MTDFHMIYVDFALLGLALFGIGWAIGGWGVTNDYRALFLKYVQNVVDDDYAVGLRCLLPSEGYTAEETAELKKIHEEVWPTDFLGPWDADKFKW